jgi:eukaryotic-like serine/threonine-protein kinase
MSLPPGANLGPYQVIAPLGTGGMGEVYRARDARLARDVALKVLLPDVAGDPERLARFDREAKSLAALSHPNIAQV